MGDGGGRDRVEAAHSDAVEREGERGRGEKEGYR